MNAPDLDGLWTWSADEEHWPCHDGYETREKAIEWGLAEAGPMIWVGRMERLRPEHVAHHLIQEAEVVEEALFDDDWPNPDAPLFENPTPAQMGHLERLVAYWLRTHGLVRRWYRILDVERIDAKEEL